MSLLTIVIPTFNAASFIEDCVASIYKNISSALESGLCRVLIKDGGSKDNTIQIVTDLLRIYSWIDMHSIKDKGVYDAMNQSLALCKTPWVYFLGADDRISEGFNSVFSVLMNDKCQLRVHYFNVKMLSGIKRYNSSFSMFNLIRKNICHQGVFYPKKLLIDHPYCLRYRALADWALNIQLFDYFVYHDYDVAEYNDLSGLSNSYVDMVFLKEKHHIFLSSHGWFWGCVAFLFYILMVVKRVVIKR